MKRRDPRIATLLTTANESLKSALTRYEENGESVELFEELMKAQHLIKETQRALLMDELLRLSSDPQDNDPEWQKRLQAVTTIFIKQNL